jgi:soluble cytochrome b562
MQLLRTLALTLGCAAGVMNVSAQNGDDRDNRHATESADDQARRPSYQQGVQHAQDDLANHRGRNYRAQYNNNADREAYQAGYDRVYNGQNQTWTGYGKAIEIQNDQTRRPSYQQGAQQAQDDLANHRNRNYRDQYDNDSDRSAYRAGYDQVYNRQAPNAYGYGDNNGRRDNGWNNPNQNGNAGRWERGEQNLAAENGFRDGTADGMSDRRYGRRSRSSRTNNYKNALRGYSYGDRNEYRNAYRQSYQRGYEQGYTNNNGYYGRP